MEAMQRPVINLEELKQVCLHTALQNGGYTHPERPAKSRRLDDKSGPEGCILHGANPRGGQSLPQVLVQREGIPIQMPTVWPGMRPMGLHQDPKATCCSVETTGNATDRLHRRHPHPGRVQGAGTGPCHRPSIFAREPRVCDKQTQVCPGTYTISGVPRFLSKLSSARTKSPGREDKDQGRDLMPFGRPSGYSQKAVSAARQTTSSNQGNSPGPFVLPQAAADKPSLVIESDASTRGWGAMCEGARTGGPWSLEERQWHINYLEALAAFHAVKCFVRDRKNITVLLRMDNTTAVAYVNKLGGTVSTKLNTIVREVSEVSHYNQL